MRLLGAFEEHNGYKVRKPNGRVDIPRSVTVLLKHVLLLAELTNSPRQSCSHTTPVHSTQHWESTDLSGGQFIAPISGTLRKYVLTDTNK